MPTDGPPPRLGADTIEARAAQHSQLWEARQRARQEAAGAFETIDDPDDVPIRRRGRELAPGREFLEWAEPREAAHRLDPEFPHQDLGPEDVEPTDAGDFRPTEPVRRRAAAYEFEEQTPLEDVDPFGDLVTQDGGFGLADGPQRELAARELDPQLPLLDVGPEDVTRTDDGFGLTASAERELAAEQIEADTPLEEVGTDDIRETDSGTFELRESVIEDNASLFR